MGTTLISLSCPSISGSQLPSGKKDGYVLCVRPATENTLVCSCVGNSTESPGLIGCHIGVGSCIYLSSILVS